MVMGGSRRREQRRGVIAHILHGEASIHGSQCRVQGTPRPAEAAPAEASAGDAGATISAQATPAPALRLAHTMTAVVHP